MKEPKKIIFTKSGYQDLQDKYDSLLTERVSAVEQLKRAREMGDLSENGFYKAAKQKLGSLDNQIFRTKHFLRYGIISEKSSSHVIEIGNTITLRNDNGEKTITLVGEHEANPSEGKISFRSPLGKELVNKKVGDIVTVETPRGTTTYKVIRIS
jgi:transcription elongation factor GreA